MKKYRLSIAALVLAIGITAFTGPKPVKTLVNGKWVQMKWYVFTGVQNATDRADATKYTTPTDNQPSCPSGTDLECTVRVNVPDGTPPANPNFTDVTFDIDGFPIGNSGTGTNFVSNAKKRN